jgi:cell division protein FtsB
MEKLKSILKSKFVRPIYNRYTFVAVIFAIVLFTGEYSIINRFKLVQSVKELKKEKEQYEKDIIKAREELKQLNTTKENLEKMAREKYLMRKQNEDVFIIDEEKIKK